jgi:branched-chain amino acid transport system substrate-binding protein
MTTKISNATPVATAWGAFGRRQMRRRDFVKLVAASLAPFPARAQRLREGAVNIGVLTDMSGLFATLAGAGSVAAAEMAVQDFGGEVLGRKIRVLFGDHKHKVDVATALVTQWFNEEHVGAIFDMPNSIIALAGQKLAAERDRIAVTVSGGSADLTGKDCTSTGFHWAYDTYSNTVGIASAMVRFGLDTWYFITADYVFGWSLEQNASAAVEKAGGRVIGHSRHPLNADNFVEYLNAAQDSGAKVIALANAGGDTINAVKQAAENGISPRSQTLVPLLVFISDVHSLGLDVAKGMTFIDGFYWDADDRSRVWSKQFFERRKVMPTMAHAGVYSSVLHYLRAVRAAGTDDAKAVANKMREIAVDDFFAKGGEVRADGRLIHDMYLVEVKAPEESRHPWDYYKILAVIPGKEAFRPLTEGRCHLVPV